jgi:hypothetical protein
MRYTENSNIGKIDAQVIVDVALAINKNPQWNPEFKLNDKDLTPADRRETHQPVFCQHYKYSEGCPYFLIDISLGNSGG